jgi:hypothetical protein
LSIAAGVNAGRLKKPHIRKSTSRHLITALFGAPKVCANKGWLTVISLFMPIVLCFTVVLSVGIGVLAAYAAVFSILEVCGRASRPAEAQSKEARPRLVLVATQSQASGD